MKLTLAGSVLFLSFTLPLSLSLSISPTYSLSFYLAAESNYIVNALDLQGPIFLHEPPHRVEFSNNSGGLIECSGHGSPPPEVNEVFSLSLFWTFLPLCVGVGVACFFARSLALLNYACHFSIRCLRAFPS